ncbi:MAG: alpha/beta hydrolase [Candidatus Freyarchaeota archaeon]
MEGENAGERDRTDVIHTKSLEGNPINSPVDREVCVYLPPRYFESDERYPVIYFLQGYTGNNKRWTVTPHLEDNVLIPVSLLPPDVVKDIDLDRLPSYAKFDELITQGELAPFIFVQPDGSLHLPNKYGLKNPTGQPETKGSYYLNSPYTGNFEDYITKDVIEYVDANYRTIPDKQHRGLIGGSMGGYGALVIAIHNPDKFEAVVSLSPANLTADVLNLKVVIPIHERLFGREYAEEYGAKLWNDILDTADLVCSKDRPLMPTIKRNEKGEIIGWDEEAYNNLYKYNLNHMIRENPEALKQVKLLLRAEASDEFGITDVTREIHQTLEELGIEHEFEVYSDPEAALSPHIIGISYSVIPAIKFCTQHFP